MLEELNEAGCTTFATDCWGTLASASARETDLRAKSGRCKGIRVNEQTRTDAQPDGEVSALKQRIRELELSESDWRRAEAALRESELDRVKTGAARLGNLLRIYAFLPKPGATWAEPHTLDFGHMLLADLKQQHGAKADDQWIIETSHSKWRLAPGEKAGTAAAWEAYLGSLKKTFLDRLWTVGV